MTAGPPTGQTVAKLNMPSATDKRTSDDMHTDADKRTSDDRSEDDTDTPSAKERSSFDGYGCADNSLAQVVSAVISANMVTRHHECKDCSRHCMEVYEAKLEMVSALRCCQSYSARRNTGYDAQLSRRLRDVLFSAIKAFRAMGYDARCHAWTHCHDYATPATGKSTAATSAPANDTSMAANASSVTGCLPGGRPPAGRTQTATLTVAPTLPVSSLTAAPLVDDTTSAPSQGAATFEATMTPAPFLVAAASTDTTPAAPYQVAAPSAPSNNGASLGLNPAGQGSTEEHTPAPPVNFTAYRLPSKTRAPSTGVKRARQTPSFIARRLQKVVVVKQRNPADRSKIRRIAVPIRTRQSLKGRYRSLATRYDLGRLGLGFRDNGVSVRQRFTNSAGVVRLGGGMTLRDNRLRRRRCTSSVNEIRARQRQRARKELRANQRLHKYPATTPAINVIPATPPAIPNGGGATGWLPVGWSNFGQGARTDVTTPAHVQLATTPAPPTLPGPTQTITPSDPTQATFMTATPTLPTEFAPTGFAQTIITPAAPTGFAPTTTATVSPASNAPTQAGLTLPPPTSTGPAPPATTFTFASTSGPSRTQPQTNISAHSGGGSRGRQSGRLSNRTGKGGTNQKAKPAEPREDANVSGLSADKSKYTEEHEIIEEYYPKILKRREDIGTTVATPHTLAIDRMYVVLLYIAVKERTSTKDGAILKMQLYALFELSDRAIYDKYQKLVRKDASKAIEGVDESAFE
ncbi:hypothetical protein H4S04_002202 [Coemansia sp. S16]|nr:hypothetical protein H4S04_002202 [Coemansia sp. S16]